MGETEGSFPLQLSTSDHGRQQPGVRGGGSVCRRQRGVWRIVGDMSDLFLITPGKSEKDCSPTLFNWQSQSNTR